MDVLKYVEETGKTKAIMSQAQGLQLEMKKYDFVFYLHLMLHILDVTNSLSQCLQRKEQDLVNASSLVSSTKRQLEDFRLEGYNKFVEKVSSFCEKHDILEVKTDYDYINILTLRKKTNMKNRHYYEYDCFNAVLDLQIQEFGDRFNEVTSDLLLSLSCLTSCDNFRAFSIQKILQLVELYPYDFDESDKRRLPVELATYIDNLKGDK
ncbi:uncharacterized protein LOC143572233 [Bidens hawaiensis]|uniref:uncharacterized protein LOC143572233 n=1 Tax=Bidens hawaiensis TaxID=980011 RepID=UPI00404958CA